MKINQVMNNSDLFKLITKRNFLFNIMPIDNISNVMRDGILCKYMADQFNHLSVANDQVQRRRDNVMFCDLHRYACLYFDARNPMLYYLSANSNIDSICVLAVSCEILDVDGCIVTDRNASKNMARFFDPQDGLRMIDFDTVYTRYWEDENEFEKDRKKGIKCAEALIPESVAYSYIAGAVVCNNVARNNLINQGLDKRIRIDRDLFFM